MLDRLSLGHRAEATDESFAHARRLLRNATKRPDELEPHACFVAEAATSTLAAALAASRLEGEAANHAGCVLKAAGVSWMPQLGSRGRRHFAAPSIGDTELPRAVRMLGLILQR